MTFMLQIVGIAWKHGRLGTILLLAFFGSGICWGQAADSLTQGEVQGKMSSPFARQLRPTSQRSTVRMPRPLPVIGRPKPFM